MSDQFLQSFSLHINKIWSNKSANTLHWSMVGSDTKPDHYDDSMSIELFNSFLLRITNRTLPPEKYRSDFWSGGTPYLSISHYSDQNGKGVPGDVERVYIDGNRLKSRGVFYSNSKYGKACFKAIQDDKEGNSKYENPVRVSIAFLDWKHKHNDTGFVFTRNSVKDVCIECLKNSLDGNLGGKTFLDGHLIHFALTRIPANERTSVEVEKSMATQKEDAEDILGDELAEELEANEKSVVTKSDTVSPVVVKANKKDEKKEEESEDSDEEDDEKNPKGKKKKDEEKEKKSLTEETLRSILAEYVTPEEKSVIEETHPLDAAVTSIKEKFSAVRELGISDEEKLSQMQEVLDTLGETIVSRMKSEVVEQVEEPNMVTEFANAVEKMLEPMAERLGMLEARMESKPVAPPSQHIPKQRSLNAKSLANQAKPQKISKLSQIVNKSVGLPADHQRAGASPVK